MFRKILSILPSRAESFYLFVGLFGSLAFFSLTASAAQAASVPSTTAGLSDSSWKWFLFGTSLLVYAAQWVDPANISTPWNWSTKSRVAAFAVLGAVVGVLHGVTKDPSVPWTESVLTGIGSFLVPLLLHFSTIMSAPDSVKAAVKAASKAPPALVLLIALGTSLSLSPGQRSTPLSRAVSHVQVGGLTGCSVLFPGLTTGTVTSDITAALTVAQTLDGWATTAWSDALPYIPQVSLTNAQAVWTKAQDVYQAAVTSLQAALAAYTAGTGPSPNWAALLAALTSAADAIVTVIDQFGGSLPGMLATLSTNSEFRVHVASVHATQTTLHAFKAP